MVLIEPGSESAVQARQKREVPKPPDPFAVGGETFEQCGRKTPRIFFVLFFIEVMLFVYYRFALSGGATPGCVLSCSFGGGEGAACKGAISPWTAAAFFAGDGAGGSPVSGFTAWGSC